MSCVASVPVTDAKMYQRAQEQELDRKIRLCTLRPLYDFNASGPPTLGEDTLRVLKEAWNLPDSCLRRLGLRDTVSVLVYDSRLLKTLLWLLLMRYPDPHKELFPDACMDFLLTNDCKILEASFNHASMMPRETLCVVILGVSPQKNQFLCDSLACFTKCRQMVRSQRTIFLYEGKSEDFTHAYSGFVSQSIGINVIDLNSRRKRIKRQYDAMTF